MGLQNICVCGWYYNPEFMKALVAASKGYNVMIVAHRPNFYYGLPYTEIPNVGLEWGAYAHYLLNYWNGGNTLYMHDDTYVAPTFFDSVNVLADMKLDQAFLFSSGAENAYNSGGHGRCIYMSEAFQNVFKERVGFWFDMGNHGFIADGHYTATKPPDGCSHHNAAIHRFMRALPGIRKEHWLEVNQKINTELLTNGRRGKF